MNLTARVEMLNMTMRLVGVVFPGALVAATLLAGSAREAGAQERLKGMPGFSRFETVNKEISGAFKSGALSVAWTDGGKAFVYRKDGKTYRYDIAAKKATEFKGEMPPASAPGGRRGRFGGPARGRQFDSATSPDKSLKAFYRDRNVWLSDPGGVIETAVTTDGNAAARVKYGKASWVYGEELDQTTALWWSPDSKKLAYYRFDESPVTDYLLQLDQTKLQSTVDAEPYPKAGTPNPIVDLYIYDLKTKKAAKVDVRDGKPFEDGVVGHYVYNVEWSPDGKELLFHRTNRRQNVLELAACDPATGKCRVVVHEEWLSSWVENNPEMRFLKDGKRFIWASERTGWKNYYLYDISGKLITPLTSDECEVERIVRVDEEAGVLDFTARSGENAMKVQLHRVGLDGKNARRLTDPAFNHTIDVAPDGKHYIDVAQTHDVPPVTRLMDSDGKLVEKLAESDLTKYESLGLLRVEMFTFKAADGKTELHGMLHRPSTFDPGKKYPLLVSVYGGPATNGARETFTLPNALTEFGFLVVTLDARSAAGRGKKFLDAIYLNLGRVEVDDFAAGVKSLWDRPYLDKTKVGVHGTSYGGYASLLCLLRYPDVFQAACASSAVTDFRHYDTVYTERYMWTPKENKKGYDAGNAVALAGDLKGWLLIYYGTADNNVHPSNAMQLIKALQGARKSFEVQVGPDLGHSAISRDRMMEFFIERLVMDKR
jgi:dipeptidyl-peptidase-4